MWLSQPWGEAGGVDLIRFGHRQVVAWPSVHERGTSRRLGAITRVILDGPLPISPDQLPLLPRTVADQLLKPQHRLLAAAPGQGTGQWTQAPPRPPAVQHLLVW